MKHPHREEFAMFAYLGRRAAAIVLMSLAAVSLSLSPAHAGGLPSCGTGATLQYFDDYPSSIVSQVFVDGDWQESGSVIRNVTTDKNVVHYRYVGEPGAQFCGGYVTFMNPRSGAEQQFDLNIYGPITELKFDVRQLSGAGKNYVAKAKDNVTFYVHGTVDYVTLTGNDARYVSCTSACG